MNQLSSGHPPHIPGTGRRPRSPLLEYCKAKPLTSNPAPEIASHGASVLWGTRRDMHTSQQHVPCLSVVLTCLCSNCRATELSGEIRLICAQSRGIPKMSHSMTRAAQLLDCVAGFLMHQSMPMVSPYLSAPSDLKLCITSRTPTVSEQAYIRV